LFKHGPAFVLSNIGNHVCSDRVPCQKSGSLGRVPWFRLLTESSVVAIPSSINSYRSESENCASRHAPGPAAAPWRPVDNAITGPGHPDISVGRPLDGATDFRSIGHLSQTNEYDVKAVTSNGITSCVHSGTASQPVWTDRDFSGGPKNCIPRAQVSNTPVNQ